MLSNREVTKRLNGMSADLIGRVLELIRAGESGQSVVTQTTATVQQVNACFVIYALWHHDPRDRLQYIIAGIEPNSNQAIFSKAQTDEVAQPVEDMEADESAMLTVLRQIQDEVNWVQSGKHVASFGLDNIREIVSSAIAKASV